MAYVELIIREVRNEPNPLRIVVITNDTTYSHVASVSEFIFNLIMKLLGNKVTKYSENVVDTTFRAVNIDEVTETVINFILDHTNEIQMIIDDKEDISLKELYERILVYKLLSL